MELFAFGQGVADFEDAVVGQAYDVAGVGFVYRALALGEELCGGGEAHRFPLRDV